MADYDLTSLDENKPDGATEEVAVLDEYQRETRTKLKAWAGVEHDLATGAHVIPHGATAPAGVTDGHLAYHEVQRELIVASGGAWRSTAQPTFNYVINGMFTQFYTLPAYTFVAWNLYGVGATMSQFGSFAYGPRVGYINRSADYAILFQTVTNNTAVFGPFGPYTYWRGKTVTFGMMVHCTMPNSAYLEVNDGTGSVVSARHPGDSQWRWLTVTKALSPALTVLQIQINLVPPATETYFSGATLVEGHSCPHPLPPGWQGRQGVLHFGHQDNQPTTNTPWWYGVGAYSINSPGTGVRSYVPFDAYVHNFYVQAVANIGAGTFTAQVEHNGVLTPIFVSFTGAVNSGSDLAAGHGGSKVGGWSVKVIRNGGNAGPFLGVLTYEEIPVMS